MRHSVFKPIKVYGRQSSSADILIELGHEKELRRGAWLLYGEKAAEIREWYSTDKYTLVSCWIDLGDIPAGEDVFLATEQDVQNFFPYYSGASYKTIDAYQAEYDKMYRHLIIPASHLSNVRVGDFIELESEYGGSVSSTSRAYIYHINGDEVYTIPHNFDYLSAYDYLHFKRGVNTQTTTKQVIIPYKNITKEDSTQYTDYTSVSGGKNGSGIETWEKLLFPNGKTKDIKIDTKVTTAPIDRVTTVGTKPIKYTKVSTRDVTIPIEENVFIDNTVEYEHENYTEPGMAGIKRITSTGYYNKSTLERTTEIESILRPMKPKNVYIFNGYVETGKSKSHEFLIGQGFREVETVQLKDYEKSISRIDGYVDELKETYDFNGGDALLLDYRNLLTVYPTYTNHFIYKYALWEESSDIVKIYHKEATFDGYTNTMTRVEQSLKALEVAKNYADTFYELRKLISKHEERTRVNVEYTTKTVEDPSKYEDYSNTAPGQNGYYYKVYEVRTYSDNTTEKVLIKPRDGEVAARPQVITKGTKPIHTTDYRYEEKMDDKIESKVVQDPNIYLEEEVVEEGVPDKLKLTYRRHYEKGVFKREELIKTEVIEPGKPTVVRVGSKKFPHLWRRLKVVKKSGEIVYTGYEVINIFDKDIERQINDNNAAIRELYDDEVKSLREDLLAQSNVIDKKVSEKEIAEAEERIKQLIDFNTLKITQTNYSFTQEYSRIEGMIKENEVELNKLTGIIRSGLDEEGNTYTDWMGSDKNKVRVSSDGITMLSNNTETLKLKDGKGYMNSLYIEHELGLGNHTARKMGSSLTVFVPKGG